LTDQEMWAAAVSVVCREYGELGDDVRAVLAGMVSALRLEKRELHFLTAQVGAERYCAECGGACCRTGKYHFSVVDLLAFLASGEELVKPSFLDGSCPYMGEGGCRMEPSLRPFPCIIFLCEGLSGLLAPEAAERLAGLENGLRTRYGSIESLLGKPLMKSLFIAYENYLRKQAGRMIT